MKGINFITNDKSQKIAVQIDLKTLESYGDGFEDLFDVIIAESRKDEPKRSWEDVKASLKKKGKL
jgi:hypothetical protein